MRYFIEHEAYDGRDGIAYFGPFDEADPHDYANDAYADMLAGFGNVEVIDEVPANTYVNPPAYWAARLAEAEVE